MATCHPGSLVVVHLEDKNQSDSSQVLRFARCISVTNDTCAVTIDPWERSDMVQEISCTLVFVPHTRDAFTPQLLDSAEKSNRLIEDPFDDVIAHLNSFAQAKLKDFFVANGVDGAVLSKVDIIHKTIGQHGGKDDISLADISLAPSFGLCCNTISALRRRLRAEKESAGRTILDDLQDDACDYVIRWLSQPSETRSLVNWRSAERVKSFLTSVSEWSLERMGDFRTRLYDVIALLERRLELILSGKLKDEMVESWLRRVEVRVDDFLASFGFAVDALSSEVDIFNERPKNMLQIRENLALLTEILNPSSSYADKVISFIVDVTKEVYVKIDALESQILQVIALTTGIEDASSLDEDTPLDSIQMKETFGLNVKHIRILLADLKYIRTQRKMDNAWLAKVERGVTVAEESLVFSHVLPISSHVNDQFRTRMNDLTNAVERWPRECEAKQKADDCDFSLEDGESLGVDIQEFHLIGDAMITRKLERES
jgi:hypothetical protein